MTDFVRAIQTGLGRAKAAHDANQQINAVLGEFSQSIHQVSRGKVTVGLGVGTWNAIAGMLNTNRPAVESLYLVAGNARKEIGSIGRSNEGFPVVVAYGAHSVGAVGPEGLRSALADLLSEVETGRALLELMNDPNVGKPTVVSKPPAKHAIANDSPQPVTTKDQDPDPMELREARKRLARRQRVNIDEPWEVQFWADELGTTEEKLREAVARFGPMVRDLRVFFGKG